MINRNSRKNRGQFYHRDSGGRHEMTPGQYVEWAQRRAAELNVSFTGTPERIEEMIRSGQSAHVDIFLDYEVSGNVLSRPGLDAMILEASRSEDVTHIFIPRRDRLARPNDPIDGMQLEARLLSLGKCLVFMNGLCDPLPRGKRAEIGDLITKLVDYNTAGKERRDLASKMIYAQIALARAGFSTGGRPPYGFRRWLVKQDGMIVRQLADGECVRMAGRHVVRLPSATEELDVIRRVVEMLTTKPATQVAAILTAEGIRPPDYGRYRKTAGIRQLRGDFWYPGTVTSIARNLLLVGVAQYGRRSMGDQLRFSKDGPRELADNDFRQDNKPKVIINPAELYIFTDAKFEPIIAPEKQQELMRELDRRGGSQRGKPRSRKPGENPMGARIFDLNCNWPMYREPYNGSFRYKCGLYQQSHGQKCAHNHVDGLLATRFTLSCIRQKLLTLMPRVAERLRELGAEHDKKPRAKSAAEVNAVELVSVREELKVASSNLARAKSDEQYLAVSTQFDQLKSREASLLSKLAEAKADSTDATARVDVQAIVRGLERLLALAG